MFYLLFPLLTAKLLRQDHLHGVTEEDCDLLQAEYLHWGGDYVRLQVPHRG